MIQNALSVVIVIPEFTDVFFAISIVIGPLPMSFAMLELTDVFGSIVLVKGGGDW